MQRFTTICIPRPAQCFPLLNFTSPYIAILTIAPIWREFAADICLRKFFVPRCENCELRGLDNVKDKYPHIVSHKIEAIAFINPQIICSFREKIFMNSLLNLIEFQTNTYRGGRKVCKLGNIVTEYPPVLAGGYSVTCCV